MTNKKPTISVIIRTYNSSQFVCKAVDSALKQTLDKKLYEIIVVDDGSKDNTLQILQNTYGKKIRVVKSKHRGPASISEFGILKSKGEYFTFLDSDDEFLPDILKKMLEVLKKDSIIDFAYCDYFEKIGPKKKIVSLKSNIFNSIATAVMFRKKTFKKINFHTPGMIFGEYDRLIRLLKNNKIGKHIPVPLYVYIRTKGSLTSNSAWVKKGIDQLREKYGNIVEKIRKY